jgi:hypothetical protein
VSVASSAPSSRLATSTLSVFSSIPSPGLNPGVEAGIAIGSVVGAVVIFSLIYYVLGIRRKKPAGIVQVQNNSLSPDPESKGWPDVNSMSNFSNHQSGSIDYQRMTT